MSFRILHVPLSEITLDPDDTARRLTQACAANGQRLRVNAVCQTGAAVIFYLEADAGPARYQYVMAPFSGATDEHVLADLHARWQGGFSTRGLVRVDDLWLGLFERPLPPGTPAAPGP